MSRFIITGISSTTYRYLQFSTIVCYTTYMYGWMLYQRREWRSILYTCVSDDMLDDCTRSRSSLSLNFLSQQFLRTDFYIRSHVKMGGRIRYSFLSYFTTCRRLEARRKTSTALGLFWCSSRTEVEVVHTSYVIDITQPSLQHVVCVCTVLAAMYWSGVLSFYSSVKLTMQKSVHNRLCNQRGWSSPQINTL